MHVTKIFDKVRELVKNSPYEFDIVENSMYVRVGHWERADIPTETELFDLGFKLDLDFDEDRGVFFSYTLSPEKIIKSGQVYRVTDGEKMFNAKAERVAEGDEHRAGEWVFVCEVGKKCFEKDLLVLKRF